MRSDYALYGVAIILFIITGMFLAYQIEFKELLVISTAVFGLLFIGLGYTQRPRPKPAVIVPPPPTPPPVIEVLQKEEPAAVVETVPQPKMGLTDVKGIKEKRAEQLKALGINSLEDLANTSAKDLAAKLKISPKFTEKWIDNAKELVKKS